MMMKTGLLPLLALALLPACAGQGGEVAAIPLPAHEVQAKGETAPVGSVNQDAADDPAIWRNAANPAQSLIIGTDKKAGLYVYGLDGAVRNFDAAGLLNNVDLAGGADSALIVASDRSDKRQSKLALFSLRFDDVTLKGLGTIDSGPGEAYGICLQRKDVGDDFTGLPQSITAYAAIKDGTVREILLTRGEDGRYIGQMARSWKLATQIEGCVTSPRTGDLYVGEEDVGIWRIRTAQPDAQPEKFASVGEADGLVDDVEGLAYAMNDDGRDYLVASSQGDSAYAVFDAQEGALLGRFRIADGTTDGVSETDGIELVLGDFGSDYPAGLFVAQDGNNPGGAQNFKLVDWREVLRVLGLPRP
ncbi:MAG: phytase [Sphingobium sp.]